MRMRMCVCVCVCVCVSVGKGKCVRLCGRVNKYCVCVCVNVQWVMFLKDFLHLHSPRTLTI